MNNPSELPTRQLYATTRQYFGMQWGQFWRWAEAGEVAEWLGTEPGTIAYRAELAELLRALADQGQGLPPLAAVLLLLAACADSWPAAGERKVFLRSLPDRMFASDDDPAPELLAQHLHRVSLFLDVVRALPPNLRTGPAKQHLLREVCRAQVPQVAAEWAGPVLDEWQSGRHDEDITRRYERYFRRALLRDTTCLSDAYGRFPTADLLTQHLRTGLGGSQLPALLAALPQLAAPAAPAPEFAAPTDLLSQLSQDARTAGLARLARHLLAGLRIPARAEGAGERPLGGVADLINRGPLDQLLLSELAHDDLTLTARLANHEALYRRREEPPLPEAPPTTILLDTTLRLWGTPRVFGLAAALAWAQRAGQQPTHLRGPVQAFALGGQAATPLDLATLPGVVAALSYLDPAPHCGAALPAGGRATGGVLITEAELVHQSADFARLLAANAPGLRFLLTVARDGTLALHEWANGYRRLVSTTQHDLAALLAGPATPADPPTPAPPAPPRKRGRLPAFLQQPREPLFLPATGVRPTGQNTIYHPALGVLSITATQRLLYWAARTAGARELVSAFPDGRHFFGTDETSYFYVLTQRNRQVELRTLTTATGQLTLRDLTRQLQLPASDAKPAISFHRGCFYLQYPDRVFGYDCRRNCPAVYHPASGLPIGASPQHWTDLRPVRRFTNNGYMVLHRVRQLDINKAGELVVGSHELRVSSELATLSHHLRLLPPRPDTPLPYRVQSTPGEYQRLPGNPKLWLRSFAWPDGSESLLDARGLLHLRSADPTLPEVTVVLVLNQPTAAWASDGAVCGPDYFTGSAPARRLPAAEFSRQYLHPFIARLG